jgi:methyl-accepting chemotaxis protein
MKNSPRKRLLGMLFIILSAVGILFSIAGISVTWIMCPKMNHNLMGLLDSFADTLTTTDNGLTVLNDALQESFTNVELIEHSLKDLNTTIDDLSSSLESSGDLIGDDLRLTILDTQTALSSAADSAVLIDNTLKIIAGIPFIGANYQPDVPLHTSLEQVAGSLEDVPESLETIEQSLNNTASGLDLLQLNIIALGENITDMDEDLLSAQGVIEDYQDIITEMKQKTEDTRRHLLSYMIIAGLIVSGIFFWLGISLVNVLIKGFDFWQGEQHVVNLADISRE